MSQEFVFVTGCPRSGTTLTQAILAQAPNCFSSTAEAKFWGHYLEAFRKSRSLYASHHQAYFSESQLEKQTRQCLLGLLEGLKHPRLVFKDPWISSSLAELLHLLPEARCVVMLRDPRDILASLLEVGKRLSAHQASYSFRLDNLPGVLHYMQQHLTPLEVLLNQGLPKQILCLKYEDLVTEPEAQIQVLESFTGWTLGNFDPHGPWAEEVELKDERHAWLSQHHGRAINRQSIGNYLSLPARAIRAVEQYCGSFMQSFDYQSTYT